ncbi:capsular polysaccharide biosynthesis protein, partial [Ideonella sp.]|uniref:capsular polysaccharide biosynthesis protein n=1 Tax=Ideonella sp. TaxID=1929293 RepID=UPI003BB78320
MTERIDAGLASLRCAVLHGRGVAQVATLPALLPGVTLVSRWRAGAAQPSAVLAWGRKPSAARADAWAAARGLPVLRLEDGFLRSVGLGPDEPPGSLVFDDLGIYYDARNPSRLEHLIARPLAAADRDRARRLQGLWQQHRVSKYNQGREWRGQAQPGDVLVVDQTAGDASIAFGLASARSFERMLEAALDEHPGSRILLKVHPDVVAGRKQGHFGRLSPAQAARVTVLGEALHPARLLEQVAAVYVVTSQMGFEALLWNKPVRCFGMPFYAGWGWTGDDAAAPGRRAALKPVAGDVAGLIHAALIAYPRYLDPESGHLCEPERLVEWLGLQRHQRERYPAQAQAIGFSGWKRPMLRRFMAGTALDFQRDADARTLDPAGLRVVWGQRECAWPAAAAPMSAPQVLRVEDGFLRSVGLGADLVRPISWVLDGRGIYYDASRPSDLEHLLNTADFDAGLRARAAHLRERLLALGLTKYNVGEGHWQRPADARRVVLVVGQVESDAAIVHGAPGMCTNMGLLQAARSAEPDAWLVYKPHPDVVARLRARGASEGEAARWCDEVVTQPPMDTMLRAVDCVHVLTSLAGFEALLRGKPVVTWGQPFYAGWGLTDDRLPTLSRRRRRLDLDALV